MVRFVQVYRVKDRCRDWIAKELVGAGTQCAMILTGMCYQTRLQRTGGGGHRDDC